MRRDERSLAHRQGVVESLVADVGNIHHHAKAVHFANDIFAKIGQPLVHRRIGRGVRPFIVAAVRQRHIAHAEPRIRAQHAQIIGDHVPALDAHQRRDLALLASFANFRSRCGENDIVRVPAHLLAHRIDLIERVLDGFRPRDFAGNPDGKENRAESAFLHPRNIDAAGIAARPQVKSAVEKALRRVVVRIHHERSKVQLARAGGNIVRLRRRSHKNSLSDAQHRNSSNDVSWHFTSLTSPAINLVRAPRDSHARPAPSRAACCAPARRCARVYPTSQPKIACFHA